MDPSRILFKYGPGPGALRFPEEILTSAKKDKYYIVPILEAEPYANLAEVNLKIQKKRPGSFIVIKGKVLKLKTVVLAEEEEKIFFVPNSLIRYGSGPIVKKRTIQKAIEEFDKKSRSSLSKIPLGGIKYGAGFPERILERPKKKEKDQYFIVSVSNSEVWQRLKEVNQSIQKKQAGSFVVIKGRELKVKIVPIAEEEEGANDTRT